jgi:hypothetical protein
MMNALLNALGVFMLMAGSIGLIINAPQLKRMASIRKNDSLTHEEKEASGPFFEYHASMLAVSIVFLATGSYLIFIR